MNNPAVNLDVFYSQWVNKGLGQNLVYMTVLYAQAILETGHFKSRVYMEANNAYGMRPAAKRPQERSGVLDTANGKFARYGDLGQSISDRVALDKYNSVVPPQLMQDSDIERYMLTVLSKGYVPGGGR